MRPVRENLSREIDGPRTLRSESRVANAGRCFKACLQAAGRGPPPLRSRCVTVTLGKMEALTVREATSADTPFLLSMARAAYEEVISLQFGGWNEAVNGKHYAEKVRTLSFLIAELNGNPIGTVSSSVLDDHIRVNELVVLPTFQNRGLGAFLLHRVLEHARCVGLPVRLHTLRLNRAVRFYQRHGFIVTARDDTYIDLEWTG